MSDIIKKFAVITGLVFVAWVLLIAVLIDGLFQRFNGWVCLCGGVLAFGLSLASLMLWKSDDRRETTEVNAIPLVFTSAYFGASILANTVFLLPVFSDWLRPIPLVVNALMLIAFVSVRMFVLPYRDRVSRTAAHTAKKTSSVVELSAKLGAIMGLAQDEAVKQQLRALKEQLDYSTNISMQAAADAEELFSGQLNEISDAITQEMPIEDVLSKIDKAQSIWRRRNGTSSVR